MTRESAISTRGAIDLVPSADSPPVPLSPTSGNEFAFAGPMKYWLTFLNHKWTLLMFALVGTAAGLLTTFLQPRLYQARASLEVQDLNDNFLNMKQVMPVNEGGLTGELSDLQTQIKILQSDSVLDPVLTKLPWIEKLPQGAASAASTDRGLKSSQILVTEIQRLQKTLEVRAIGQTRIIELTAESRNPRLTADFLNQLCAQYIEQNMKARWEMGQRTSESLARMLEETRVELKDSEDALQDYARKSGLMFTSDSDKENVAEQKLSELQDELSKAQDIRIAAQARYETAKKSSPGVLPDELSQGSLREYKAKLTELQRQRADLATTYTPDYNKVKGLDAQIAALEAAIQAEQHDIGLRIENEYQEAAHREALLSASYGRQSVVVTEASQRTIQYNMLKREVDGNRELYDEMLKQVKEVTVASAVRASNIRVVDQALPPKQIHSPKVKINCALGLLIGLFLGTFFVLKRDANDSSLREPGDGQYLGVAELGAVLHDGNGVGLLRSLEPKSSKSLTTPVDSKNILGITKSGKSGRSEQLRSLQRLWLRVREVDSDPLSASLLTSESCRAVVTSLLCASNGTCPRTLVVTSPGPSEGKTTVLANLGITLAAIGRRVLLVDGDVRRHRLHELFGMENDHGLSTLLEAGPLPDGSLDRFIQRTPVPGLSVLTSGPSAACVNRLHSSKFSELLRRLRDEYEFVLIDSPPLLQIADARVIGRVANGVILVVRAGVTSKKAAAAAYQRLADDDTRVVGLILNDWNPKSSPYGYYYQSTYAAERSF